MRNFIFIIFLLVFVSCNNKPKEKNKAKVLIEYNGEYLYLEDVLKSAPKFYSEQDSAIYFQSYISIWLEDRLFFSEAKIKINDSAKIVEKLNKYRRQLYINEYLDEQIYSSVSDKVSFEDIEDYYNKYLNNYILTSNYVKAHYMTLTAKETHYWNELETLRSSGLDDEKELNDFCVGTGRKVYFYKEWTDLNAFLDLVNFKDSPKEIDKNQKFFDYVNGDLRYLVKIDKLIEIGDTMPIELASPQIYNSIIMNRKKLKYKQVLNELKQNAIKSGSLIIK